jgi:carboxyl-terminal processing protease
MAREVRKKKKGVSVGVTIALCAVCAAVAFSIAYIYAMNTFNSKVTDLSEKQAMFTKLYEVDSAIRENYGGDISEEELQEALASTYVKNIDRDNILYVPEKEYDADKYSKEYKSYKISDGSYVLIKKSALKSK